MDREPREEAQQAADEFADAIREQAARMFDAVFSAVEKEMRRHPGSFRLRPEPLSEEEADKFALDVVHQARKEMERDPEDPVFPAPSEEEIQSWQEQRRNNPPHSWGP
jgi:hypothetical protein